jgi:hypothetical protein
VSRKLERQLNELKEVVRRQGLLNSAPVYCREEREDVDPERLVIVKRVYVDPPERGEMEIPIIVSEPDTVKAKGFYPPLEYSAPGVV